MFLRRVWARLFEASPEITENYQRRQATMLSALLFGLILLALLLEGIAVLYLNWPGYTGYRQTLIAVLLLAGVYFLSRTRHLQLAATLTIIIVMLSIFVSGWYEPRGVKEGFFDFLIIPLWLGTLYFKPKNLLILVVGVITGIFIFPLVTSGITITDMLTGPFTFIAPTAILLMILTQQRNKIEQDRQSELAVKEQTSRREALRADALLRMAERFNAQIDLDAVLATISEEAARALNAQASIVSLYNHDTDHLTSAAGVGIASEMLKKIPPFSRTIYEKAVQIQGPYFSVADLQVNTCAPYLEIFNEADFQSVAFVPMKYEHELIGDLSVIATHDRREFTQDELLLLHGMAGQAALALVNTTLYKDSRRRLDRLQALRTIDIAIASSRNLKDTLDVLLKMITEQLKVDAAVFLLLNEGRQQLEFTTSRGFVTPMLRYTRLRMGEGIAGRAAQQKKVIYIQDLHTDPQSLAYAPSLAKEGFTSYFAAPLISQGKVKGVLEIFQRAMLQPDEEWIAFLEALAGQAAIAIESTTLFEELQQANQEITQAYDSTIEGWSHALDLRDRETEGHTQRVTQMTLKLARATGFTEEELVHIKRGALLHDIGKMGVPDTILLKPDKLTEVEWEIMRKHPTYAHDLMSPITYLRPALDIPYCHHEKWDGTGYPRGLSGEEIPLAARIFAVVDVYDALISDRPYRKAWSEEETLAYIRSLSGTHFDPRAVDLFLYHKEIGFE